MLDQAGKGQRPEEQGLLTAAHTVEPTARSIACANSKCAGGRRVRTTHVQKGPKGLPGCEGAEGEAGDTEGGSQQPW